MRKKERGKDVWSIKIGKRENNKKSSPHTGEDFVFEFIIVFFWRARMKRII